jgi:flagellar M-ring protein FliF
MKDKFLSWMRRQKDRWDALERGNKIRITGIVLAVLVSLVIVVYLTTRPNLRALTVANDHAAASRVEVVLNDSGIRTFRNNRNPFEISVQTRDFNRAASILQTSFDFANDGLDFAESISMMGMSTTDSVRRETFRRVTQSEIERRIVQMDGIDAAFLTLDIDQNNFILSNSTVRAKANLIVRGNNLTQTDGQFLAEYLSMAIIELDMNNIFIFDHSRRPLYSPLQNNGLSTQDRSNAISAELVARVQNLFIGSSFSRVSVSPTLVFDNTERTEDRVIFNPEGLIDFEQVNRSQFENTPSQVEPGIGANNMMIPNYPMGGEVSSASVNQREVSYIRDITTQQIVHEVGALQPSQSSLAISAISYVIYDEAIMRELGRLDEISWSLFQYEVTQDYASRLPVPADEIFINHVSAGTGIPTANISMTVEDIPIFIDMVRTSLNIEQLLMFAVLAVLVLLLAYGLLKKTQPDEITEIEPELSVQDLLVSTQLEEKKQAEADRMASIEFEVDTEIMRHIEKFINEKPDAAALLLRNWLNESWE